jgi:hypothetical protein
LARNFIALVLLAAAGALAQGQLIEWRNDPQQAVAEARKTLRPLMVYVLGSTKDRDAKQERGQKRAFDDPRVVRLSTRFVPLKLSRSQHANVLKDFFLPESASMMMSFVSPDGQKLDDLGANGIEKVDSLLAKMNGALKAHANRVYETTVKPKLTDAEATPADLKEAVRLVEQFEMDMADKDLVAVLDRTGLDQQLKAQIYDALAGLSTKTAVDKLLELSHSENPQAAKALEKCTPAGADILMGTLTADADPFDYTVYKVVTKICGIREVKPAKFFENTKGTLKEQELARVRKLVTAAAQRWKESHE